MAYPELIKIDELDRHHPEVQLYSKFFETVDDLIAGGETLKRNLSKYLVKKPEEDTTVYNYRKSLFTYTPILTQSLNQLENRITTASYNVTGIPDKGMEGDFWRNFRQNLDLSNLNERDFFKHCFSLLLKYRKLYLLVDLPDTPAPTNPKNPEAVPYIVFFTPKEVIDYYEEDNQLQWIKIKRLIKKARPLAPPKYFWEWVIIDEHSVVGYQVEVEFGDNGEETILYYQDPFDEGKLKRAKEISYKGSTRGELWGDDPYKTEEAKKIKKSYEFEHGLSTIPVVSAELKDELWVCNQAIYLVLEHIRISNNLTYTGQLAGMVQRLFTPLTETINDVIDLDEAKMQLGNDKVLIGSSFNYSETTGSAIGTVSGLLDRVENAIKDIVFSVNTSMSGDRTSGRAKAIDYASQEKALESYGKILVDLYTKTLKLVAEIRGYDLNEVNKISVTGLSEFTLDTVETKLQRFQMLESMNIPFSDEAKFYLIKDLTKSLLPHLSPEEFQNIFDEYDILKELEQLPEHPPQFLMELHLNELISRSTLLDLLGFEPRYEDLRRHLDTIDEIETMMGMKSLSPVKNLMGIPNEPSESPPNQPSNMPPSGQTPSDTSVTPENILGSPQQTPPELPSGQPPNSPPELPSGQPPNSPDVMSEGMPNQADMSQQLPPTEVPSGLSFNAVRLELIIRTIVEYFSGVDGFYFTPEVRKKLKALNIHAPKV